MRIEFLHPEYVWLLLILPLFLITHILSSRYVRANAMKFANFEAIERVTGKRSASRNLWQAFNTRGLLILLTRVLITTTLILSLTQPVLYTVGESTGTDYAISIDASLSMLATDILPDRLTVAKETAVAFVDGLPDDSRVGIISFSGTPLVMQGLTREKGATRAAIKSITHRMEGSTSIGEAIVAGTNLLLSSQRKKAVVILTDGEENIETGVKEKVAYANHYNTPAHIITIATKDGGFVRLLNVTIPGLKDTSLLEMIANGTNGTFSIATTAEQARTALAPLETPSKQEIPHPLATLLLLAAISILTVAWTLGSAQQRTIP